MPGTEAAYHAASQSASFSNVSTLDASATNIFRPDKAATDPSSSQVDTAPTSQLRERGGNSTVPATASAAAPSPASSHSVLDSSASVFTPSYQSYRPQLAAAVNAVSGMSSVSLHLSLSLPPPPSLSLSLSLSLSALMCYHFRQIHSTSTHCSVSTATATPHTSLL